MRLDVERRIVSLTTGDGSAKRLITIPRELDATTVYRAQFDGWQYLERGASATLTKIRPSRSRGPGGRISDRDTKGRGDPGER